MATEKKPESTTATAPAKPAAPAPASTPEIAALQQTVEALRAELLALKRAAPAPTRIPVEGIFAAGAATLPVPTPVQDVIKQYEALERALQLPIPPWVFPGSGAVATRSGTSPTPTPTPAPTPDPRVPAPTA